MIVLINCANYWVLFWLGGRNFLEKLRVITSYAKRGKSSQNA